MALSVLITQCLQRDFVEPIQPYEPLPNRLHVGPAEALRLLGPDPSVGPVAQLMASVRALPERDIEIIHIRDWHDPEDPRQKDHLATFGAHCVRGSEGARLVLELDQQISSRANETVVESIALNDFEGTTLGQHLAELRKRSPDGALKVGVVGVWTEAKVSFLLYDLKTCLGIDALATCSALTASASRSQHFNALEQLGRILGVQCFDSVGDFISWLAPGASHRLPPVPPRSGPQVEVAGDKVALSEEDRDIVGYLYRDSSRVALQPLRGGFSGALVFRASAKDAVGHQQAPSVVKLGPHEAIARERVAFERVEEILGNHAPSVRGFVDLGERAGIKYSYAAMGQGAVRSLKSLFESQVPQERLDAILRAVFEEILGPLYVAARYERLPILEHYGFSPTWAPAVRKSVEALVGARAAGEALEFPGGYRARNVCRFYEEFLAQEPLPSSEHHFVSLVHGDLNAANILVDARENVWVIDYFHTGPGHVLKDLAKLENDLLYILTPIDSRQELEQALKLTRALRSLEDLRQPLPGRVDGVKAPQLLRAWACLRTLRDIGSRLAREDRHPMQMDAALLRYAVHTLSFEESSALQKEWALASACGFAEDIVATVQADRALRVDWLDSARVVGGRVGLTICPGRRDRGRHLEADLDALKQHGVSRLLCLLTDEEMVWAGVGRMAEQAAARGITFRRYPIRDQGLPEVEDAASLAGWCLEAADRGQNVVVHCLGGLGRAGTIAACLLASRGATPEEAIADVRRARGPRALETADQERFVTTFANRAAAP